MRNWNSLRQYQEKVLPGPVNGLWDNLKSVQATHRTQIAGYQSFLPDLLNDLSGMTYRCRLDGAHTMEFVSEGCLELTGYQPSEIVLNQQVAFRDLLYPGDRKQIWKNLHDAIRNNHTFDMVYRIITKTGVTKWVRDLSYGTFTAENDRAILVGVIYDISARKRLEQKELRLASSLDALRKIELALTSSFDLGVILTTVLEQTKGHQGFDAADILVYRPHLHSLDFTAGTGLPNTMYSDLHWQPGESPAWIAFNERRTFFISDLTRQTTYKPSGAWRQFLKEGFVSYLALPLIARGEVKGVLEIFHRTNLTLDDEMTDFIETVGRMSSIAIDNRLLFENFQRSSLEIALAHNGTLDSLIKALELRDKETEGHTRRVTELTLRLGHTMRLNDKELYDLEYGAMLHDIGKIGIPDEILLKSGPLSEAEWVTMRRHPIFANELLSSIPFLQPALDIPYCHHERWDGSGYPRKLKGKEIPLAARIFAVVDVFDALLSDRSYRLAWTRKAALNYISEQSGKEFDPEVVQAFLKLMGVKEN